MSKIVVIGSINMDLVNQVKTHPLPGETIHSLGITYNPGGKGANQAVAASLVGGDVTMIGAVGTDPFGIELIASLERYDVRADSILEIEGTSGMAFITVDLAGENSIILSAGANGKVSESDVDAALPVIIEAGAVLLQNEIPLETTLRALREAHKAGSTVYFNPAPAIKLSTEVLSLINVIILNETEAEEITGIHVENELKAQQAALKLLEAGVDTVVLTLGSKGSLHLNKDGHLILTPAFKVQSVDTTAAGDTFIGTFAVANESGMSLEDALKFASAAAAITVTRKGAQASIPNRQELEQFLMIHS